MTLDNISASTVEAVLSEALRPDGALSALGFMLRPPTPQKLEQVLGQLASEPPPHRLDLNIAYSSPAAFAAAVHEVVSHLDGSNLSPVYLCNPPDGLSGYSWRTHSRILRRGCHLGSKSREARPRRDAFYSSG
jgi:hypothetical protein